MHAQRQFSPIHIGHRKIGEQNRDRWVGRDKGQGRLAAAERMRVQACLQKECQKFGADIGIIVNDNDTHRP